MAASYAERAELCGVAAETSENPVMNPKCPNCGRAMRLVAEPNRPEDQHTFACEGCGVVYLTEDHTPTTGTRLGTEGEVQR